LEDAHHIFVECPRFSSLRTEYEKRLHGTLDSTLNFQSLSLQDKSFIFDRVRDLFKDSPIWPSQRAVYYLGILPTFVPPSLLASRLHMRITHLAHITCVQLAGRIWGVVRRNSLHYQQKRPLRDSPPISLPPHLARLFLTRHSSP
jgi:hypothetical protein